MPHNVYRTAWSAMANLLPFPALRSGLPNWVGSCLLDESLPVESQLGRSTVDSIEFEREYILMPNEASKRRSGRRLALLLLAGGMLLALDAWAQESGAVSSLTEDVLQLFVWSVLMLPLVVSVAPYVESRTTRYVIFCAYGFAVIWRVIDVTNELPVFDALPVFGNDSRYHEPGKEFMALIVRGSVLLVFILLFVELTQSLRRLRTQSAHLQKLFQDIPAVCFTFDKTGRVLTWNRAAETVYGYTAEEAVNAEPLSIVVTPETLDATKEIIAEVFAGNSILGSEWHDQNKDGELGYRLGSAFPLFRDDGTVECGVNINVDITARRNAEAALASSEERFRRAFDEGPLGMMFIDREHRIAHVNRAMCKMLGYERDEFVGQNFDRFADPDDHEQFLDMSEEADPSQPVPGSFEKRYLAKDGRVVWGRMSATVIHDDLGQPLHGLAMIEDITEHKHAEDKVRASETRFRAFFDSHIVGIVLADMNGSVTGANDAFLQMVGRKRSDLPIQWSNLTSRNNGRLDRAAIDSLRNNGVAAPFQLELVKRDGRQIPVLIGLTQMPHQGDECIGFVVDLTEQKHAEAAAESERDLLRRLLDLQERERQTVSCEIHDGVVQYVVGAMMQVDACETTLDPADQETAQKLRLASDHLANAMREGRRLISSLRPPIIDESGITAAIDHLISEISRDGGPSIEFEHHGNFHALPAFVESALYRISQEALNNVRRHSGSAEAWIRLERSDLSVRLEVKDKGRGFLRIAVPPDRFGLQSIEQRARLLGGSAQIESHVGAGTRIRVELPLTNAQRARELPRPHAPLGGGVPR